MAQHLLIVDDDKLICTVLSQFMTQHGYRVSVAHDGRGMLQNLDSARIDLVVLDVMLPGESGLNLCRRVRSTASVPIIMLTAVGGETDRIVGLEMGADDYLAKPFNARELLARVRAVLRRAGGAPTDARNASSRTLEFGGWRQKNTKQKLFSPAGALVPLRAAEFDLLLALAERPQRVLTRDQLLDLARGRAAGSFDRSGDVQISRLRRKLGIEPDAPEFIKTVRGGGYVFAASVNVVGAEAAHAS